MSSCACIARYLIPNAPFDPSMLDPTGWYRATYGGVPWTPTPSGGLSGSHGNMTALGTAPSVGGGLNGLTPPVFNGTTQGLSNVTHGANEFVTTMHGGGCTAIVLFNLSATVAPSSHFYDDPQLLCDEAGNWGLGVTSSGYRVGAESFGSDNQSAFIPIPTNEWALGVMRYNGDLAVQIMRGRLYRAGGVVDVACSPTLNFIAVGSDMRVGKNYNASKNFSGQIAELLTFSYEISDVVLDQIRDYVNARYALTLA